MPEAKNSATFYIFAKDEASGKLKNAANEFLASVKKMGIGVAKEGKGISLEFDKMGQKMTEAGRHSRYLGEEIGRLAGKIGSIRNMILVWMFALRPLINNIKESVEAARQQEDAERRLAAAFAATGAGSRAGANAIIEQASALQTLTGASDNEIISAASILATFKLNEQQIQRLLPLLVDMSALVRSRTGEEMSLASVAKAVGTAFTSNASRLEYLGIQLDATTKKTKDFNLITAAIEKSVSGAAVAMAGTFSGQLKIFSAAMGDFRESIGNVITRSPYFISVIHLMTEAINKNNQALKDSQESTNMFAESWQRVLAALVGVWTMLKGVGTVIMQVGRIIDVIIIGIAEFISKVLLGVNAILIALLSIIPATKGIQNQLIRFGDELDLWRESFKGANKDLIADIQAGNNALANMTTSAVDLYAKILEGAAKAAEAMGKDVIPAINNLKTSAYGTFNAMETLLSAFAVNARNALADGFVKMVKGDFESLKDVVVSFGDIMLKTIMEIIAQLIIMTIWKKAAGFLGFGAVAAVSHTGGYIYAENLVYGQPRRRFHSGGEVPATLLEGEGVLNRRAMANLGVNNLDKLNRGEAAGGTVINNYYIQTIDERSFRERLQEHGDIYTGASERGIKDNMSLRKTSQRFG